jgi:hypothetical protein
MKKDRREIHRARRYSLKQNEDRRKSRNVNEY